MSVADLLDRTSSWEWEFWLAFAAVEPFGPVREDRRAAEQVVATYAVGGVRVAPGDVFDTLARPRPPRDAATGKAALAALCPALTVIHAN